MLEHKVNNLSKVMTLVKLHNSKSKLVKELEFWGMTLEENERLQWFKSTA